MRVWTFVSREGACSSGEGGTDGKDLPVCTCICGSAYDCGCVVNGSNVMVAS